MNLGKIDGNISYMYYMAWAAGKIPHINMVILCNEDCFDKDMCISIYYVFHLLYIVCDVFPNVTYSWCLCRWLPGFGFVDAPCPSWGRWSSRYSLRRMTCHGGQALLNDVLNITGISSILIHIVHDFQWLSDLPIYWWQFVSYGYLILFLNGCGVKLTPYFKLVPQGYLPTGMDIQE